MNAERRLDRTYDAARHRFLDAAAQAGATVTPFAHPSRGREDEELAIDVATVGHADADAVLVVVSGTHGVEGYAGSALQSWWLNERASDTTQSESGHGAGRNSTPRVVLVHALNPYGFSWVRRVNEDNVDLNRNFVEWTETPPTNPGYGEIADLLVPPTWDDAAQQRTTTSLLELAGERGMDWLQQSVSGGQYEHEHGLFYGGTGPVWSHDWLAEHLPEIVGTGERLVVLDLHTGLGPWGHGELISSEHTDSERYQRSAEWWGDVRSMVDGDSVSAELSGDWLNAIARFVPDVELTAIAIEYGTVDMVSVLQSLRADAWLHSHGDPTAPDAAAIRSQVRAAFVDDDPAWLERIIERFDEVSSTAIRRLSD